MAGDCGLARELLAVRGEEQRPARAVERPRAVRARIGDWAGAVLPIAVYVGGFEGCSACETVLEPKPFFQPCPGCVAGEGYPCGASFSIAARSSSPAPCLLGGVPRTFWASCWMNCLTPSGVRSGYFWRIRAMAPAVIAVASDVPEPRM